MRKILVEVKLSRQTHCGGWWRQGRGHLRQFRKMRTPCGRAQYAHPTRPIDCCIRKPYITRLPACTQTMKCSTTASILLSTNRSRVQFSQKTHFPATLARSHFPWHFAALLFRRSHLLFRSPWKVADAAAAPRQAQCCRAAGISRCDSK